MFTKEEKEKERKKEKRGQIKNTKRAKLNQRQSIRTIIIFKNITYIELSCPLFSFSFCTNKCIHTYTHVTNVLLVFSLFSTQKKRQKVKEQIGFPFFLLLLAIHMVL